MTDAQTSDGPRSVTTVTGSHPIPPSTGPSEPNFLRGSRDWWRDEADQRSRDHDRDFLILGVAAAAVSFAAFWLGVLVG